MAEIASSEDIINLKYIWKLVGYLGLEYSAEDVPNEINARKFGTSAFSPVLSIGMR